MSSLWWSANPEFYQLLGAALEPLIEAANHIVINQKLPCSHNNLGVIIFNKPLGYVARFGKGHPFHQSLSLS
tara:strand:- start:448 stop:663 length:216 start_codon:yes stop_codon:yes gene_type:complete